MANEFKIKKGLIVTGASGGTVVDIQGSQGQLFSVTDNLSGSIFAVSDISGVPILDVNSSGVSYFDGTVGIGTSSPGKKLEVKSDITYDGIQISGSSIPTLAIIDTTNNAKLVAYARDSDATIGTETNHALTINTNNTTALTLANNQNANFAGDVTVSGGDLNVGNSSTVNSVINMLGTNDSFIEKDTGNHLYFANNVSDKDIRFRVKDDGTNVIALTIDGPTGGNSTFATQAFATTATSSGDDSSTLTTKGYVDGLITGATIYRGAWDPSGGGYGSPDLSGVTQTSGYYYICSAAGTAEPNGTGCEPDSWETGDWVIWNDDIVDCAGTGTGGWQKIDNSSVLSGVGTGQTVALWEGAGSVTDSDTLGNAPITVSGNNATFAGNVSASNFYGLAQDLAVTSNDTFNGTYSLLWHDGADVYSSTWMTVNGSNDTLTVPTIAADLNGTINTATTGATQTAGDNSTLIATTAYVDSAVAAAPQGDITAVTAGTFLTGGGTTGDVTLNADATKLAHIVDSAHASVASGWITVALASGDRRAGEIYVTDGESSDHSYIRIEWMRSYADSNFTVINCGGHANRIQGVRVLEETSDVTYGPKYLQVKVTTTSDYYVIITAPGTIPNYGDFAAVTPVLENTKTGYQLTGAQLEDLQNSSVGTDEGITVGGDLFVNGGDIVLGGTGRIQGVDTVSASTDAANKAYVDAHVSPGGTYLPLAGGTMTGSIAMSNQNITGVNQLTINDPGEGILFTGTTNVNLYVIDDTTDSIVNFDNASEIRRDGVRVADVPYIASRSQQLMTNYNGLLGNNYNFPGWTFDGQEANYSPGSFKFVGSSGNSFTSEYIAVDTAYKYKMSLDAKTLNGVGRYYCMTLCYDVDQNQINANNHMYRANTSTTLAVALNPGDTTVTLAGTGSNWYDGGTAGVSTHLRSLIIWEYTNSLGYTYPPETYSRLWYSNAWDPNNINGNVITLRTAWAGPSYPVGTRLSNGSSGGSYKYNVMSNKLLTTDWTQSVGFMDGVDLSGTNVYDKFPPGTAKIRMGFLPNYNSGSTGADTIWITNFNIGIDTVLTKGDQSIDGAKTFTTVPVVGTMATSDNSTSAASTAWVTTNLGDYLPLTGGTLTGALAGTSASFSGALSSDGYSGTSGTFSASVTAAGNSNSFGNTSIAALTATSGTFSLSVTAAGNSNSFGTTTLTGDLTGTDATFTGLVQTKIYKTTSASISNTYVRVAEIDEIANQLSSSVRVTMTAHGGSHVTTCNAIISVGHSQDILIQSNSLAYTQVTLKVESNNNGQWTLSVKSNSPNASTYEFDIQGLSHNLTITPLPTASQTGTTLEHTTNFGTNVTGVSSNTPSSAGLKNIFGGKVSLTNVDANTTSVTALVLDGDEVEKRTLGTGAFGPTPVGAYLPLTAGSGSPLTDTLYVQKNGNANNGTISMGIGGSGTSKWSFLTGTHYNQATGSGNGTGSAGMAIIGSLSAETYNKIYIGGGPYEINAATQIDFWTNSSTLSTTGGTLKGYVDSGGNWFLGNTLWVDATDDYVGIGTTTPEAKLDVQPTAANRKVTRIANDVMSTYFYNTQVDAILAWTCGSYYQAEVVITANQTNGGTTNNLYIRGIWSNNHTSHHWDELEHIGSLSGSTFTMSVGQDGSTTNSGRLELDFNYISGSFSQLNVRVTDFYGSHSYTIT